MGTKDFLEELPFVQLLGIEIDEFGDGAARGSLEMRPDLSWNADEPMAHGGVTVTLAEVTGAAAMISLNEPPVFTVDLRVDFLAQAHGDLVARADVVRDGTDVGVVDVTVVDEREESVASGTVVYKL